jgi:hypothetical protein
VVGPPATISAIVLGYVARSQIKRTGEQGAGLALAGLILGWAAVILGIALIAAILAISSRSGAPAAAGYWLGRRARSALPCTMCILRPLGLHSRRAIPGLCLPDCVARPSRLYCHCGRQASAAPRSRA